MQADNFAVLQTLLKQRSGLVVVPEKAYLLESRLMPVARKWSVKGLDDLVELVRAERDEQLPTDITEAMTTNETSFFRDAAPFEQFKSSVLPALMERRASDRHIRIWCTAASTGQEPYSLAMILKEQRAQLQDWRIEDPGHRPVDRASRQGRRPGCTRNSRSSAACPSSILVKYFSQIGDKWELSDDDPQDR